MSKNCNETQVSQDQIAAWKPIVAKCFQAVFNSDCLATSFYRKLQTEIEAAKYTQPLVGKNNEMTRELLIEMLLMSFHQLREHDETGTSLWAVEASNFLRSHVLEFVRCREIIDTESGLLAAEKLQSSVATISPWATEDLLKYAWNDGYPKCPDILGNLVARVHNTRGQDGGCIKVFGPFVAQRMFCAASPEGMASFESPIQRLREGTRLYRVGDGSDPQKVASGMTWRLDPQSAYDRIDDPRFPIANPILVSTMLKQSDLLASFKFEEEVVVKRNTDRRYEIVPIKVQDLFETDYEEWEDKEVA